MERANGAGRLSQTRARVFPIVTATGAALLLTHSHALANIKEEVLVEISHVPIAVLGLAAAGARWLEVESANDEAHWAGWIWPVCFVLVGLMLLGYREA